jgi:MFS family permease
VSQPALSPAQRRMHLAAVTLALTVTALIYGLCLPLLSLVMHERGVDGMIIGLSAATQSLAVAFVAPFLPRYMSRIGPARIMLGAILLSLTTFLLLPVFTSVPAWFVLRFALGTAGSCLWVCGEAWINQVAEDSVRGRVVALFSMATAGGFALGPLLLTLTGTEGARPFLIAGAMILASAVPLLSVVHTAPILEGERKGGLAHYLWLAPVPMLLCGLVALADGAMLTFLPLYGMRLGLSEPRALHLLTLMGVGGVLGQIPIGWLADRVNRMLLASVCTLLIALASLAMPLVLAHQPWNLLFMLVFGAILNGIYTVAMVLIGNRFRGADLAAASALFGVMWGSGSILGPSVGGLAMDFSGPHGLPLALTLMFAVCLPMQVGAWLRRRGGDRSD